MNLRSCIVSSIRLVIAEKPSVSQALATVLGARKRQDGYLEGNGYIVSWCVGHLVEMAAPDEYDPRYTKWRREDLPIIPSHWLYAVSSKTKKQFDILKQLMAAPRVTSLVCATDAGREGELIFRLVVEMCGCRKPIERLWISSLEESAIQKGFQSLKSGREYENLYQSALCRAQADWLVGMNASRLLSSEYNRTLNVGRVMTPTLFMVTAREAAIASFQTASFYSVELDCGGFAASSERMENPKEAESLAARCNGRNCTVQQIQRQERRERPPKLYDLTTLQREANRLHGFTAQQTLDYTQSLYEKKLCTYPRTDSRFLPSNMRDSVRSNLNAAASTLHMDQQIPPLYDVEQILCDAKVTDHHAIIPTVNIQTYSHASLPSGEGAILKLLIARLMCAVSAPYEYAETTVQLNCEGAAFTSKGKQVIHEGWRAVHALFRENASQEESEAKAVSLPQMQEGAIFSPVAATVKQGKTSSPGHFTEDSLLAAMERAGAQDAPEDAEHKGLGTPATRAATIEKLIRAGFVERKGDQKTKYLLPTSKGTALIAVSPENIRSPQLTAQWEEKLKQIEHGTLSSDAFMQEIAAMLQELTRTYVRSSDASTLFPSEHKVIGTCPRCQSNVVEKPMGFFCESGNCGLSIWKNNYFFTAQKKEVTAGFVTTLLRDGRVLMQGLKSKKTGKPYDAYIVLDPDCEKNARFKIELVRKAGKS